MRAAAAVCCGLAMACTATLAHPPYTAQLSAALVQVDTTPPPARVEVLPPRPNLRAVWVDGEWTWRRGRWAWLPGRWVNAPDGETFSPWAFVRGPDGGLWYAPGAWHDAAGAAVPAPVPQAVAAVEAGDVVNADGSTSTTGPTLRPPRIEPQSLPPR